MDLVVLVLHHVSIITQGTNRIIKTVQTGLRILISIIINTINNM
jgi:hypothetical protein